MSGEAGTPVEAPEQVRPEPLGRATGAEAPLETTVPFPVLAAPTVVHVSKLSSEAIAWCDVRDVEYVVIEPAEGGVRLRPAGIEDQLQQSRRPVLAA